MNFLVIDDDATFREATCYLIDEAKHYAEGAASGAQGLVQLEEEKFDAVLLDLDLGRENGLDVLVQLGKTRPDIPVVICTARGDVKVAVEAMRRGAVDFLEKPFGREQLATVLARIQRFRQLNQRIERLEREVTETKAQSIEPLFNFSAPPMREVMDILLRAAPTPASILLLGESGTGKSVAAREVHRHSVRAGKPFVTVSCPSLSKELLQSELFGHVHGAFTGAVKDHWGKVKAAEGGTLFLDEIGDLPAEIQPKLLRLLQEREYERLGENVTRSSDVRVIAATNRDLKKRVADGLFREDLYFRLNVITVELPPLRARPADLLELAGHYAKHFAAQCGRPPHAFTERALSLLQGYAWPGNLRELQNVIERAVILGRQERIEVSDLPAELRAEPSAETENGVAVGAFVSLDKLERVHICKLLERVKNLTDAAAVLGIDQATLYRKRKRFGL